MGIFSGANILSFQGVRIPLRSGPADSRHNTPSDAYDWEDTQKQASKLQEGPTIQTRSGNLHSDRRIGWGWQRLRWIGVECASPILSLQTQGPFDWAGVPRDNKFGKIWHISPSTAQRHDVAICCMSKTPQTSHLVITTLKHCRLILWCGLPYFSSPIKQGDMPRQETNAGILMADFHVKHMEAVGGTHCFPACLFFLNQQSDSWCVMVFFWKWCRMSCEWSLTTALPTIITCFFPRARQWGSKKKQIHAPQLHFLGEIG